MSESSLSTSSLQRVVARDADAWQRVVHLYRPTLYSMCRRRGLQPDDAANVVQEVFLAAFKSVGKFKGGGPGSSFRAWLLGIAANKLKDYWKCKIRNPSAEGGSEAQRRIEQMAARAEVASTNQDDGAEKAALLRRALDLIQGEFEVRTWQAFCRFEVDGQPAAAVAAELGTRPNAVHVAVCRVRKRLREEFADLL